MGPLVDIFGNQEPSLPTATLGMPAVERPSKILTGQRQSSVVDFTDEEGTSVFRIKYSRRNLWRPYMLELRQLHQSKTTLLAKICRERVTLHTGQQMGSLDLIKRDSPHVSQCAFPPMKAFH
jgi:hypothetical protein